MTKKFKLTIQPECINGQHVYSVSKGWAIKFAWPRDGKSSREVAEEIAKNWPK